MRQHLAHAGRAAVVVLLLGALVTTAWPSCDSSDAATGSGDFDPGPTYGAEIVVTVVGRGRVSTQPGGVNCPGRCFARVVISDPTIDGAVSNVMLSAEPTGGSYFKRWKFETVDLGVRARGPSQCSPMMRASATPPFDEQSSVLSVNLGETTGTPPKGREGECADFTAVPLAYAVTAVFEEYVREPTPDGSVVDPGSSEVLYQPALANSGTAGQIGIAGGLLYWTFAKTQGSIISEIAIAPAGGGGPVRIAGVSNDSITMFDVDKHVVFQQLGGQLLTIAGGTDTPNTLTNAPPACVAVASDSTLAYCRALEGSGSVLYSWPISGLGGRSTVYNLPHGNDLAVDESTQKLYFSDDQGAASGTSLVQSAARSGDGGAPAVTVLAFNQHSPRNLVTGSSYLFWLDAKAGGVFGATSAPKLGAGAVVTSIAATTVRFIVADPAVSNAYWIGISDPGSNQSSILQAGASTSTTNLFRQVTSLNGLAVDDSFVYWTETDGRVYRASKLPEL